MNVQEPDEQQTVDLLRTHEGLANNHHETWKQSEQQIQGCVNFL